MVTCKLGKQVFGGMHGFEYSSCHGKVVAVINEKLCVIIMKYLSKFDDAPLNFDILTKHTSFTLVF